MTYSSNILILIHGQSARDDNKKLFSYYMTKVVLFSIIWSDKRSEDSGPVLAYILSTLRKQ